jgi:hypothetical protein
MLVYAARPGNDPVEVEIARNATVAKLKKAAVGEINLGGVSLDLVTLTLEGREKPLDSRKTLAAERVVDGSSVIVHVAPVASAPKEKAFDPPVGALGGGQWVRRCVRRTTTTRLTLTPPTLLSLCLIPSILRSLQPSRISTTTRP